METEQPRVAPERGARWRAGALQLTQRAASLAWCLPLLLTLYAIYRCTHFSLEYGVNAPCSDGWPFVELHEKVAAHKLGFSDLFFMNNEHLMVVPRLLFAVSGAVTKVNMLAQSLLTLPQLFVALVAIWLASIQAFGFKPYKLPWWFVPIAFLMFNLNQARNLLCSFQSSFVTAIPFSLLAYYCLVKLNAETEPDVRAGRRRAIWFSLAGWCATLGVLSMAMGVAAFPAGLLILLLCRPIRWRYVAAWCGVGALACGTYFYFFFLHKAERGEPAKEPMTLLEMIRALCEFAVELAGAPLAGGRELVLIAGALTVLLFVVGVVLLWRLQRMQQGAFFIAMGVHALMTCALVAFGRIHLGGDYALNSRYVTLVVPLWISNIALGALIWRAAEEREASARGFGLLNFGVCLALLGVGAGLISEEKIGGSQRKLILNQMYSVLHGKSADKRFVQRWRDIGVELPPH